MLVAIILFYQCTPILAHIDYKHSNSTTNVYQIPIPTSVSLTVDIARNPDEIAWGLMGRTSLPNDYGMVFVYQKKPRVTPFWMFNTYINLSIAFIDEYSIIREIHELTAHPEKMKNIPKLNSVKDLKKINLNDSTVALFMKEQVMPSFPISFALEVASGWFHENQIRIGDVFIWKKGQKNASILRSIDLSQIPLEDGRNALLELNMEGAVSIWLPAKAASRVVSLLDKNNKIIKTTKIDQSSALYTQSKVKYIMIQ